MSPTLFLFAAVVSFAIDQTTKSLALATLGHRHVVSFRWVAMRCLFHADASRVLGSRTAFLTFWVLEIALLLALVQWSPRFHGAGVQIALGIALGGATGNLVDRLWRGGVVNFIDLGFWPVFNLADAAIVAGALLAALSLL